MDRITTPKIHAQYAKAKEMEKSYADAEKAYEKAKDLESVVRLNLQHLDNPQKAFAIVRKARSAEGAAMVAEYCKANGQTQAAIEFLLLSKHNEEAFKLAEQKNEMPAFAQFLGDDGTQDECRICSAVLYFPHCLTLLDTSCVVLCPLIHIQICRLPVTMKVSRTTHAPVTTTRSAVITPKP
jgi:WD repeat-containing protein 19